MIKDTNQARQSNAPECKIVYQYLQNRTATLSPLELIQEWQNLLQQGRNGDREVSAALEQIILATQPRFDLFLSHCFQIILDRWAATPQSLLYIDRLFNTLDVVGKTRSYDRRRKQLAQLIKNYQQTASYSYLRAVAAIISPHPNTRPESPLITDQQFDSSSDTFKTIADTYLVRYTYLYQCFLPQEKQFCHLTSLIEKLSFQRQQDFEILLSKHIIYRFRLKQLAKMKLLVKGAGKMIVKANNPSLLSEKNFRVALQHYVGKIEGKGTLLERSQHLNARNKQKNSYLEFKRDLYNFITSDIKPRNHTYNFNSRFKQKLLGIFTQSDGKPLNKTLILQTCRQLFSFLIVDYSVSSNTERFSQLVANLGTAQVMLILIKITLVCPESKLDLEKKICSIVARYQSQNVRETIWLLKCLEHLLISFSVYFGNLDVSVARSVVSTL